MTLVDVFLQRTGCSSVEELHTIPPELRRRLAAGVDRVEPGRVPLKDWNTLIAAFGGQPVAIPEEARRTLILLLLRGPQSVAAKPTERQTPPQKKEEKKKASPLRKIWNGFTTLVVIAAILLAILLVGVRLAGFQVFAVLSGSMEPVYHVGALIYVKSVDPADLKVGNDITFMLNEDTIATHRIIEILPDEEDPTVLRFRTQGVANSSPDGTPVHYKNVVGKPVFTIPYLGYVSDYIQNPPGTYVTLAGAAVFLILVFLPDLFGEEEPQESENANKKKKTAAQNKPRG